MNIKNHEKAGIWGHFLRYILYIYAAKKNRCSYKDWSPTLHLNTNLIGYASCPCLFKGIQMRIGTKYKKNTSHSRQLSTVPLIRHTTILSLFLVKELPTWSRRRGQWWQLSLEGFPLCCHHHRLLRWWVLCSIANLQSIQCLYILLHPSNLQKSPHVWVITFWRDVTRPIN